MSYGCLSCTEKASQLSPYHVSAAWDDEKQPTQLLRACKHGCLYPGLLAVCLDPAGHPPQLLKYAVRGTLG